MIIKQINKLEYARYVHHARYHICIYTHNNTHTYKHLFPFISFHEFKLCYKEWGHRKSFSWRLVNYLHLSLFFFLLSHLLFFALSLGVIIQHNPPRVKFTWLNPVHIIKMHFYNKFIYFSIFIHMKYWDEYTGKRKLY